MAGDPKATLFGFECHTLGDSADSHARADDPEALAGHLSQRSARALVFHDDPATAVARGLQAGQGLAETLLAWGETADRYLRVIRKAGRKVALCRRPDAGSDTAPLAERLAQRFPGLELPPLPAPVPAPDPVLVALAALALQADGPARKLADEVQARSLSDAGADVDPGDRLTTLLAGWTRQQTARAEAEAALEAATRTAETLTTARDAAQKTTEEQRRLVGMCEAQIHELQASLAKAMDETEALHAAAQAQEKAQDKAHAAALAQLQAAQDAAQTELSALRQREPILVQQLDEVQAALATTVAQATAHAAQIAQMTSAAQAQDKAHDAALAQLQTAHDTAQTELSALRQREPILVQQLDEVQAALAATAAQATAHETQIATLERAQATARADLEAGRQRETLLAAQLTEAQAALARATAEASARDTRLTAAQRAQETLQAELEPFRQREPILIQQISELQTALGVTDGRYQALEAENRRLETFSRTETETLEDMLDQTRSMLSSAQTDGQSKRQSRDTLKQQLRQFEGALTLIEKRRAEARRVNDAAIHALQAENQALQQKIESMYASTSWRITGPMRSIKRLISR